MRTDPRRLELRRYPFVIEAPPRFNDMDALRHLNNVALAAFYEEGRVALHRHIHTDRYREKGDKSLIAQVNITYLDEGRYPDVLQVATGLLRVGGASYTIGQALFQQGRCIGVADTVAVNARAGRPHPLSDGFRAALESMSIDLEGAAHG